MQMSDGEPAKWNLALNNARNLQSDLGAANVEIEIDDADGLAVADQLRRGVHRQAGAIVDRRFAPASAVATAIIQASV